MTKQPERPANDKNAEFYRRNRTRRQLPETPSTPMTDLNKLDLQREADEHGHGADEWWDYIRYDERWS